MKKVIIIAMVYMVFISKAFAVTSEDMKQIDMYALLLGQGSVCGADITDYERRIINWINNTFKDKNLVEKLLQQKKIYSESFTNNDYDCITIKRMLSQYEIPVINDYDNNDIEILKNYARADGQTLVCGALHNQFEQIRSNSHLVISWIHNKFRDHSEKMSELYREEMEKGHEESKGNTSPEFCTKKLEEYHKIIFPTDGIYWP